MLDLEDLLQVLILSKPLRIHSLFSSIASRNYAELAVELLLITMLKTWDPLRDMPALDGKVAVVTGGKYVSQHLQNSRYGSEH